jgi:AcrR family transcriptional regulator
MISVVYAIGACKPTFRKIADCTLAFWAEAAPYWQGESVHSLLPETKRGGQMGLSEPTVAARPRERILDAATRLFYDKGIQAVGVNRIIADADVAPMTLYRQFGGKDELVAATIEQWSTHWLHWLTEQIDQHGDDPRARLAALWDALEGWFASDDFRGSLVDNAASELRSEPDHPAQRAIRNHRMALRQLLEDLAKMAHAHDHADLAAQLQVVLDGAVAVAAAGRGSTVIPSVRALADAAISASQT